MRLDYLDRCLTYTGGEEIQIDLDKLANNSRARAEWEEMKLLPIYNKGIVVKKITMFPPSVQQQIAYLNMTDVEKSYIRYLQISGENVIIDLDAVRNARSVAGILSSLMGVALPARRTTLVPLDTFSTIVQRYLLASR